MKILIVIDQYDGANNGTTISARRFVENLRKRGHIVKVITTGEKSKNKYIVKKIKLTPIVNKIVTSQGMVFAKPNKEILTEAIKWADIVHFYMPFFLAKEGLKIAKKLEKPMTSAFHVQPENITYTIGLGKNENVNNKIYTFFRDTFFNQFNHIHCPSEFIANELRNHGYTAKLHVISNGIEDDWVYNKEEKPKELKDKFVIMMVGRFSAEKKQDVLINAIKYSKYSNNIQLIFAGQGPKKQYYIKLGEKLKNKPIFNFYTKEELKKTLAFSDLYVHTAHAEIEAISCIEAIATGLVPIIAESDKSATTQFALDERSKYKAGDEKELAKKIDYWIEHEEERHRMEKEYARYSENFKMEKTMEKIEEMFEEEIKERKNK